MKFPNLALGQRFVFQDERYTKTGPMTASRDSDGVQRMILRSAAVVPLDAATLGPPTQAGVPDAEPPWLAALDAYEQELRDGLGRLDATLAGRLVAAMAAARAAFNANLRRTM
ncbi:MAG TPA: hypothetical protein VES73_05205 [Lamprocystis sp. (in: g-proteobacteria)]|nr:hypothetical protein [Lamprocystis sp. (in: g-proteobacteria)]